MLWPECPPVQKQQKRLQRTLKKMQEEESGPLRAMCRVSAEDWRLPGEREAFLRLFWHAAGAAAGTLNSGAGARKSKFTLRFIATHDKGRCQPSGMPGLHPGGTTSSQGRQPSREVAAGTGLFGGAPVAMGHRCALIPPASPCVRTARVSVLHVRYTSPGTHRAASGGGCTSRGCRWELEDALPCVTANTV